MNKMGKRRKGRNQQDKNVPKQKAPRVDFTTKKKKHQSAASNVRFMQGRGQNKQHLPNRGQHHSQQVGEQRNFQQAGPGQNFPVWGQAYQHPAAWGMGYNFQLGFPAWASTMPGRNMQWMNMPTGFPYQRQYGPGMQNLPGDDNDDYSDEEQDSDDDDEEEDNDDGDFDGEESDGDSYDEDESEQEEQNRTGGGIERQRFQRFGPPRQNSSSSQDFTGEDLQRRTFSPQYVMRHRGETDRSESVQHGQRFIPHNIQHDSPQGGTPNRQPGKSQSHIKARPSSVSVGADTVRFVYGNSQPESEPQRPEDSRSREMQSRSSQHQNQHKQLWREMGGETGGRSHEGQNKRLQRSTEREGETGGWPHQDQTNFKRLRRDISNTEFPGQPGQNYLQSQIYDSRGQLVGQTGRNYLQKQSLHDQFAVGQSRDRHTGSHNKPGQGKGPDSSMSRLDNLGRTLQPREHPVARQHQNRPSRFHAQIPVSSSAGDSKSSSKQHSKQGNKTATTTFKGKKFKT